MTAPKKETAAMTADSAGEDLRAQVVELTNELLAANARITELLAQVESLQARPSGSAGWLVKTPNTKYSGSTAGVQFRSGRAFIPAGEAGDRLARLLHAEFDYAIEFVEDWQAIAESETIRKTLIDSLMLPHRS